MIRITLGGLFTRKLRTILTMIAIIIGVSMISGTYILTDTISKSFSQIYQQATRHIDAVITGRAVVKSAFEPNPPVPARLLSTVDGVSGVSAADGEIADQASLFGDGHKSLGGQGSHQRKQIGASGGAPSLLFGVGNQSFNQLTLISGHWPKGNQIVLDQSTIQRNHLRLGQPIGVATVTHPLKRFILVGKTKFGTVGSIGGATLIEMDLQTAQRMTGKVGKYDQISVMADAGVSQARVVRNIRAAIPPALRNTVRVRSGEKAAADAANQIGNALSFLTIALLAFGGVAVFVGAFIIFNTFSITVAQRAREFALLRTLGSSRGQILRSVMAEALLIGLVASLLGLLFGFGTARALNALFTIFGVDLPSAGLVFKSRTLAVALLVGTLITLASGLVPAIRATRVPPIVALREGSELPKTRFARFLPLLGCVIIVLGLALTLSGIFASISSAGERLLIIGGGCLLLFLGVSLFSPQLIRPFASTIGWPLQRFTAVTGRLARDNAIRNPSRTAVTAAALMIGLALVAFVTIFAAELKKTADDVISREIAGTFIIQDSNSALNAIPPQAVRAVSRVNGVALISPLKEDAARIRGIGNTNVDGVDPKTVTRVYRFEWKHGSNRAVRRLRTFGALIADGFASDHHLSVGSTMKIESSIGRRATFTVRGIFKSSQLLTSVVIPAQTFSRQWEQPDETALVVNADTGVNKKDLESRISAVLNAQFPTLSASSQQQYKSQQDNQVNSLLALIYVLLGLSIVVSLFGIINTLVLSIYERTREIGMLRAIGATRSQIRWMIRWESVITSLIGAIFGLILGVVLAVIITIGLQSQGIEFAMPVGQLLIWVVLAIVFGVAAAAFPARRAAHLDVLRAVSYE